MTEKDTQKIVDTETVNMVESKETVEKEHHGHDHHDHHHHHHKHSHHSKHRHRKNSNKKESKFAAFMKKHRSVIVNIASCTVSVVLILVLAFNFDFANLGKTDDNHTDVTQTTIKIETSIYLSEIRLVNDAVINYTDPSNNMTANKIYQTYSGHKIPLNKGLPVSFTYRLIGLPGGVSLQSATLEVSEYDNYRDARVYSLSLDGDQMDIYNLKTGTKYFYRVNVTLSNDQVIGTTGSFVTEASPRILNIDGVDNIRDIGGWVTEDGKTIRQGLLYRGTELDGAVQSDYFLTERGLQQMIGELGIRFDMDLRSEYENIHEIDALGKNVVHKYYGAGMYSALLTDNQAETLRQIFSDLANPDNYPIYMHCTYGKDRTGSVCYLLEALLGMSKKDMNKEFEMSALTDSYVNLPEFRSFIEQINSLEGASTQEKVEGYLLSIGVTAEEIASIRTIFLGE